jgi:hypothetical protein
VIRKKNINFNKPSLKVSGGRFITIFGTVTLDIIHQPSFSHQKLVLLLSLDDIMRQGILFHMAPWHSLFRPGLRVQLWNSTLLALW